MITITIGTSHKITFIPKVSHNVTFIETNFDDDIVKALFKDVRTSKANTFYLPFVVETAKHGIIHTNVEGALDFDIVLTGKNKDKDVQYRCFPIH